MHSNESPQYIHGVRIEQRLLQSVFAWLQAIEQRCGLSIRQVGASSHSPSESRKEELISKVKQCMS